MAAYPDPPSLDGVFRALADPGRRRLLDSLNARNGQTLRELCADMDMARQSVSKHLAVLEEANLVTTVWRGREKLHYLNAAPITDISERWINRYEQPRVDALDGPQTRTGEPLDGQALVRLHDLHPDHARAPVGGADQLRVHPALLECGVRHRLGAGLRDGLDLFGVRIANPEQVVLEADPPRRLSYTWHTFTPSWPEPRR